MADTPSNQQSPQVGRWIRVYLKFGEGQPGVSSIPPGWAPDVTLALPVVVFPNEFRIGRGDPRQELKAIGRCMYCNATEFIPGTGLPLSEEHFVTEGLGSRLVLLDASCKRCAEKTSNIERMVLRWSLLVPRIRLGIRRKKRKRAEALFPVSINQTKGNVIFHTSLEDHPSVLFLPVFNPPGLMIDRTIGESGFQSAFLKTLTALPKPGYPEFATPAVDTAAFCQLIAKIAHGFAVLELGLDGFTPLLPDVVLKEYGGDNSLSWFHLVGGDPRQFAPAEAQHVLGWGFFEKNDTEYLIVSLRLLADEGAPVYFAVAGTLTSDQSAKAHAAAEVRAQERGTTHGLSP
jgi:hypothetical protein